MIRAFVSAILAGLLLGCQTPPAVRDMSTLAAKFASQMDNSVTVYVAALNADNNSDVPRLQNELSEAARLKAANADEAAVWRLVSGAQAADVNRLLAMVSSMSLGDANPLTGEMAPNAATATISPGKITFDSTPLKTIETVAGGISKPKSASEQVSVISAFAKTVQSDLKTATAASTQHK
jgi:hypothetical protein